MCAVPILSSIWDLAFGKVQVPVTMNEAEQSWVESVAWKEVASKRISRAAKFVKDPCSPVDLLLVALVSEPLRWLTGYFLHLSSRRRRRSSWECPLLCSFTSPTRSPITRVLQYFSNLLLGLSSRLYLLLGFAKQDEFKVWAEANPDPLRKLRWGVT
eukprot:5736800-Heterocapsa_arctica.AAC.1